NPLSQGIHHKKRIDRRASERRVVINPFKLVPCDSHRFWEHNLPKVDTSAVIDAVEESRAAIDTLFVVIVVFVTVAKHCSQIISDAGAEAGINKVTDIVTVRAKKRGNRRAAIRQQ